MSCTCPGTVRRLRLAVACGEAPPRSEARWRAEALVEMLTVKFGPLPDGVPKTVHAASVEQIKAWAARAVTAETWTRSSVDRQHTRPAPGVSAHRRSCWLIRSADAMPSHPGCVLSGPRGGSDQRVQPAGE
jgi:hypothetical protein